MLSLPWRLTFVQGGNHSIAAGIFAGEGEIWANEVFEMSPIIARVACDGVRYSDKGTARTLFGEVKNYRPAAIFEIGRMLHRSETQAHLSAHCHQHPL